MECANQCQRLREHLLCRNRPNLAKGRGTETRSAKLHCITEHIGFWSNCLDVWVLETAYYAFQQQPGADSHTGHAFVYLLITLPFSVNSIL